HTRSKRDWSSDVCSSDLLTSFGIACLRFDFPGLGQSEGDFAETSFSENIADIQAAAAWLAAEYNAPQLLIGHSLGGAAALAAGEIGRASCREGVESGGVE